MAHTEPEIVPRSRTLAKERRREQLIKATINCIAKRGFSATTMADITKEAKLSLGIVNLHFQSKEKLLLETLKYLTDEYQNHWEKALNEAAPSPVSKLISVVNLDFSKTICTRKKIAVWFAFWGEAKSRPIYMRTCAEYDGHYTEVEAGFFAEIIRDGNYQHLHAQTLAATLDALTYGLWLDMLLMRSELNRDQAKAFIMDWLHSIFPNHFQIPDRPA